MGSRRRQKTSYNQGSRQTGKTEAVRHFAERYDNFVEINFALESKYRTICADGYDTESIISNISVINPSFRFIEHKTLIFFDEIQDYPEIATALKSFNEDRRFDCICSGSMLGINYKRIESNSVGNKSEYILESLDYEEFLWAKGYDETIGKELLSYMKEDKPFPFSYFETFTRLFIEYCIIGGMPRVVVSYIKKGTFEGSLALQQELLADYKEDIKKYVEGLDKMRVLNVYENIPVQLAKENKKFQISKISSGARFREFRGCVEWLDGAGLVNVCYSLNTPSLPLKGNYDQSRYKVYLKKIRDYLSLLSMKRVRRT